jgi:hypothetical protein
MRNAEPWDFADAYAAYRSASQAQANAEKGVIAAATQYAAKEQAYRMALAKKIMQCKAEGASWSAAQDLARGDREVSQLRYERDVQAGVKLAAEEAVWRAKDDRKDAGRFIDWSRMVAPLGEQREALT